MWRVVPLIEAFMVAISRLSWGVVEGRVRHELVQRLPGIFGRDSCPVGNTCFFQKFVHQQDETGGSIVCTVFHIPVIAVLVEVVHQFLIAPSFGLTGFEGFGYFAFPSAAQTGPVGAGSLHGGTCVICHQFWIGVGI